MTGLLQVLRGDARNLPLADQSVDLVVTSPPYFALRSYQDGGKHYDGQIGAESTPAEFVDALVECTREMVRVLKPSGSIFVNLGDKYAGSGGNKETRADPAGRRTGFDGAKRGTYGQQTKTLMGIPWRYALRCIDDLGLILRAEIIWSKPNGLPESVTDRVRRSHEQWFHFTVSPRYFSAVDEVREPHSPRNAWPDRTQGGASVRVEGAPDFSHGAPRVKALANNPLGKLPGSVWSIPTEPLRVPPELGVDHFAAFPSEWPRRFVLGWSPREVCSVCGEGRRPVSTRDATPDEGPRIAKMAGRVGKGQPRQGTGPSGNGLNVQPMYLTGYACACPDTTAPSTPGVVLDPFGGTGTTAHVAAALGRQGISIDLSADYCRLAENRDLQTDRAAKVLRVDKPAKQLAGQADLFAELGGDAA